MTRHGRQRRALAQDAQYSIDGEAGVAVAQSQPSAAGRRGRDLQLSSAAQALLTGHPK
jgi:hypothetical protein